MNWDFEEDSRLPFGVVANYFRQYPRLAGIDSHQLPHTCVTSVSREPDDHNTWSVTGYHSTAGQFEIRSKKICLATGAAVPRKLGIPGEAESDYVFYSLTQMKSVFAAGLSEEELKLPLLVIGGSITAADTVIQALLRQITVAHVFRETKRESRKSMLGRLSGSIYPEYFAVSSLMSGGASDSAYLPYPCSRVLRFEFSAISKKRFAFVEQTVKGKVVVKRVEYSYAVVNIGFRADLSFLDPEILGCLPKNPHAPPDNKYNALDIHPATCRINKIDNLYAVGQVMGDNYMRYIPGGCFAAARNIVNE